MTAVQSRLQRDTRRRQIIQAAKQAFSRSGFVHTSLDDVAAAAGISKALIYRHFDTKRDLYLAVLEDFGEYMQSMMGPRSNWSASTVDQLIEVAATDPEGFLLLFEHAAREPEFADVTDVVRTESVQISREQMPRKLGGDTNVEWAARLVPTVMIQAVVTWVLAGRPRPDRAAGVVRSILDATTAALRD